MKALAKTRAEAGLKMIDAEKPVCGPGDVLIRVRRTAICGTDLHIWKWDDWAQKTIPVPMIVGHEFSGEIAEIGKSVTRPLTIGQKVSGEGHIVDFDSAAARAGHPHLDPNTKGIGVNIQGAFAEYLCLPASNVICLSESVDLDAGALLDPCGNAVHTAQQFELMGEDVLVTGAGPIGIMAAMVARRAGAHSVVLTDRNDWRLELSRKLVDAITVNTEKEDLKRVMTRHGITGSFGVALEMSGAQPAIQQCIQHLDMGGKLAMLGIPAKPMEVNWSELILKAITVKGVYGREMFETWRKMLALIESGLDLTPLITHRVDADDYKSGFEAALSGQAGKVVMRW